MKLISWNVNGIRAAGRAGFLDWFKAEDADLVCLQEIKATPEQLEPTLRGPTGYHTFWHPATKPGYSGVAIYSKKEPLRVQAGIGIPEIDSEGRVILAEFPEAVVVNAYFPNSQRDHARLPYKLSFCTKMLEFCDQIKAKGKNIILCGDLNIAHKEIDLRNPATNQNNAGFLPQERSWLDDFEKAGYIDTFRQFEKGGGHYTWWSYRPGVREKNIGWRLDYFWANQEFSDRLKSVHHRHDVKGSDHCPVVLELRD